MPEIVVRVPELEKRLQKEVEEGIEAVAKAEVARALMLERMGKTLAKSELTEEDALKLGREAKKGRFEELRKKGLL